MQSGQVMSAAEVFDSQSIIARGRARRARGQRRPAAQAIASLMPSGVADLTGTLEMAVALNRARAAERDLRLHCYGLDRLRAHGEEYALLRLLDDLLRTACRDALWGSLVMCEAGWYDGGPVVRVRYARCDRDTIVLVERWLDSELIALA